MSSSNRAVACAVAVLCGLLSALPAAAQTRTCVREIPDFLTEIDVVEGVLRKDDLREARILLELLDRDWECLAAPLSASPIARYAHIRAFMAFRAMDGDEALRWVRAAEAVYPGAPWPDFVPDEHPVRRILDEEGRAEVVRVPGKYVAHPKKGGLFVGGRFATEVAGPVETPMLVQAYDQAGAKIEVFWHDGPGLPERWTTDDARAAAARPPRWWDASAEGPALVATVPAPVVSPEPEPEPAVAVAVAPEPAPAPLVEPEPSLAEPVPAPEMASSAPPRQATNCPAEPVTVGTIATIAADATDAFARTDRTAFEGHVGALRSGIPCLAEVMDPAQAAVVHRLHAYRAFVDGDDPGALRSFQVALALDPTYALPDAIAPAGGPLAALYERGRTSPPVSTVPFVEPDGMSALVDGATRTRRPISAPAFVQLSTAEGVYWSAYLTPTDPLPEWLPTAKAALLASVGTEVVDAFADLRAEQVDRRGRVEAARAALLDEAAGAFGAAAEAARGSTPDGRAALEAFVARYDGALVVVDDQPEDVVVPQVAAARAWLGVFGAADAEAKVADHATGVEAARAEVNRVASAEWSAAERMIAEADYRGDAAVTAFVDKYGEAAVQVGDATERVFVPEVDVARDWAQIYTLAGEKLPDTSDSLAVVLGLAEERRSDETARLERVTKETAALLGRATEDWGTAMSIASVDTGAARIAVERFVIRYSQATVGDDEHAVPVAVPELPQAEAWLAANAAPLVALPTDPMPQPRRARLIGSGVGVGVGAAVVYGTAWVLRSVYNASPNPGMFYATNGAYFGSVALGTTAGGLLLGGLLSEKR